MCCRRSVMRVTVEDGGFFSVTVCFFPKGVFRAYTFAVYRCSFWSDHEVYGNISGQLVNWSKSSIYFGYSVSLNQIRRLQSLVGMHIGQLPFSYLEVSLCCDSCEETKLIRVAWNRCCRPHSQVGLGLTDLGLLNDSLLKKLTWKFMSSKGFPYSFLPERLSTGDCLYRAEFQLASRCSVYGVSSELADNLFL
ncbi:hypothetical protein Dsin_002158 [Dipteronia sinensis]|uniref:Uncharacterized protein n=1 Tax=Dipteronia sinensis TaxID=43782 RepID=A0AAE0B6M8_9ROSI|nr:hypothetical protein Dsin_002158 [Dipteronia sinensis]